ncbi:MAG TPA: trypsin-like peptidase domain-containing protein [Planctomycetota bacterium]|nr:trypsin-like peptidase domain-containing protein [Planctomycetota bacterium]
MRLSPGFPLLAFLACGLRSLAAQEAVEDILRPSVVKIRNDECYGSGMFVDRDGLILTNAHVACSPLPYRVSAVTMTDGTYKEVTFRKVALLGFHTDYDLALLRVDPAECGGTIRPVVIAGQPARVHDRVWATGFPSDVDRGKSKVTSWGELRSNSREYHGGQYLELDLSVFSGNSGGPLCNDRGEVLGVVTAMLKDGALAVPISEFRLERFGPLRDRTPNRTVSVELIAQAEKAMETAGKTGPPPERAMLLFEIALLWDPGNAALYSTIGQLNLRGGRPAAAAAYLVRSLRLQPWSESPEAYRSLGLALNGLRQSEEAVIVWTESLQKFPADNAVLWGELASSLEREGRHLEAICSARIALKTFTPQAQAMNDLCRQAEERLTDAELSALRNRVKDLDSFLGRMQSAAEKARRDGQSFLSPDAEKIIMTYGGAQQEFAPAALRRPDPAPPRPVEMTDEELTARFIRGRITVAREHLRDGRVEKAVEILDDLVRTYPSNAETEPARLALRLIRKR